jgi:hypothetical protein
VDDIKMNEDDKIQVAVLKERIDSWMESTEEYRRQLCEKIAELKLGQIKVMDVLYSLPCPERKEWSKGIEKTMLYFKLAIGFCVGLIIAHLGWR